ncbi:MAG TPA: AmmeMemoRadiSam system protein A [Polyangiaceae bacterium]|nr:MAG: hypothetical protein BWY17_00050 [Deltaproteobacteria bacterium ADurb.Bin207]HNS95483.1 AmmeMemoRadiSam system protein A [Polyangiaceae bacterium]HNZ20577.1 AmmeMemoRadiSam system protein A [Polyangiaceae bacterium]HOD20807.1 AmmeMemoRadiSam system protein A [Polyangiaceae bacterium]HOE47227.1 AmmeMemoRadiSam system protein A [Polyangiaceae bacterium]
MGRWSWPWGLMLAVVGSVEIGCRCAGDDPVANSGYGSVVDSRDFDLTAEEKQALLTLARTSVETWVRDHQRVPTDELVRKFPKLNTQRACFVTLRRDGQLRGCIGSLEPYRALVQDVRDNAVSAAMHDTRFRPVEASELSSLRYSLSVLDMPRPLQGVPPSQLPQYLSQHRPGVIIELRGRRSTFLPSVWEDLPDAKIFLSKLCMKQGAPSDCWMDAQARISTYGSINFGEP